MEKGIVKNKAWILPLFILTILAVNLVIVSAETLDQYITNNLSFFGDTTSEILISLIVALIIIAGFYDVLELISIFDSAWVKTVISIGLGLIAVILKWPVKLTGFIMGIGATFGAIGIALEIIVVTAIFIGLVFGGSWAAKLSAKRRAAKAVAKGELFAGKLRGLKKVADAASS